MSLTGKYELQAPVAEGAIAFDQLIDGKEISTGRPVSIHILAGGSSAENETLLREIRELPREYKAVFIETGEHHGDPFVVTDALSGGLPFRKWFESLKSMRNRPRASEPQGLEKHRAWQIPVQVSAPPTTSHTAEPGEFTRMFQVPKPVEEQAAPKQPVQPAGQEPGEFTRLFKVPDLVPAREAPALEPAALQEPAAGEFAQLFKTQVHPPALTRAASPATEVEKEPPAAQSPAQPGEFTQFFQARVPQAEVAKRLEPVPAPELPVQQQNEPGEFTRFFQVPGTVAKPDRPAPPPPSPPAAKAKQPDPDATLIFEASPKPQQPKPAAPGEFTQMFASPQRAPSPVPPRPPVPDDFPDLPAAPPPAVGQPGEFTRMMESPLARAGLKPQKFTPAAPEAISMKGESSGFTRMLESPVSPRSDEPSMPQTSRQEKPTGDATRAFRFPAVAPAEPPSAEPAPPQGPSEFTQMFQAPAKEAEPKQVKPAAKPQRVTPRRKKDGAYLKWILAGSGILLIIALIVFFALRD